MLYVSLELRGSRMKNKLFWGILTIVLVFGISVVGCDAGSTDNGGKIDTTPSPPAVPTGLSGTVDGNSVQLTWQSVENANVYSLEYKKDSEFSSEYKAVNDLTSTNYTVTGLASNTKYNFRVAAQNTKGEKSNYSTVITVTTSNPKTGTVSIKELRTTHRVSTVSGTQNHSYSITVELELPDGAFWKWASADNDVVKLKVQTWVTITGLPSGFSFNNTGFGFGSSELKTILVSYSSLINSSPLAAPNLTATIDQSKLEEMKGYTNITDTLTTGTSSTASSTAWVDSN
jgi:hypothetical protein